MKKIALLIPALLLCAATSFAQPSEITPEGLTKNPGFRMGLSFSTVFSWLTPNGGAEFVDPDGARLNIGYGLHTDFGLGSNRNYYFSTGLFVLNTGGTLKYTYQNPDDGSFIAARTIDYRFNYINIPLTMMLRTNEVGYTVYFARVGIDNGLKIKSVYNSKDQLPDGSVLSREDEDSPDYSTLYRAGLHIEGGAEFNLTGTTNLFVSVTWNNGLNNIFSKKAEILKNGRLERINGTSNAIMVNVGVYF
ncbi:PorT family protein [Cryomorpha ignava]|uniref:PorT family protein n=1 Tax=Cryomorpha ignava TaxID=101383 RepID=A0A7K3WN98_9FLAO|nr:outer membrane beta-barrel protein [Cryomorpha ignava]NEN22964.1 PorT family protein [Cryomorpha ignava]